MEALENLLNNINTYLLKLKKNHIISVLTQLGISIEGKQDVTCKQTQTNVMD